MATRLVPVDLEPDAGFGVMFDLSEDGAAIQLISPIEVASRRTLRWKFPEVSGSIQVTAEVVRIDITKFAAFRFIDPTEPAHAIIRDWLKCYSGVEPTADPRDAHTANEQQPGSDIETIPPESELNSALQQARTLNGADGVAIALGSGEMYVCCASLGLAPPVGVTVQMQGGLSAECIRTAKVIYCPDVDLDPRVDVAVCKAAGFASAVAVPIVRSGVTYGMLECFWRTTRGFNRTEVMELCKIADSLPPRGPAANCPAVQHCGASSESALADVEDAVARRAEAVTNSGEIDAHEIPIPALFSQDQLSLASGDVFSDQRISTRRRVLLIAAVNFAFLAIAGAYACHARHLQADGLVQAGAERAKAVQEVEWVPVPSSILKDPRASTAKEPQGSDLAGPAHMSALKAFPEPAPSALPRRDSITLDVTASQAGEVTNMRVVNGEPVLTDYAKEAIAKRQHVGKLNPRPLQGEHRIIVDFGGAIPSSSAELH